MMRILQSLLVPVVLGSILFGSAGRWDVPFFWGFIAVLSLAAWTVVATTDPDLLRERAHPAPGGEDRALRSRALPFFLAHLVAAGLDVGRFHWSSAMPTTVQAAALLGLAGAMALDVWSIRTNRFFSPVVRIQEERGHHIITSGPYRWLRHPGYAAAVVMMICSGAALGSWWSMAPLVVPLLLIVRRTALEDRFLRANLGGYAEYSSRVPWRLLPWIW